MNRFPIATRRVWCGVLCAGLTVALPARADCVDGVRQPTSAELDFARRAAAASIAGLPEAVPPLARRSPDRPEPAAAPRLSFCAGQPVGDFSSGAGTDFAYTFSAAEAQARSERRRQLQRQIEELEKLPPDKEAQRRQLEEQMRAAYAAAPRRSRNDPPLTPEQQAQSDRANAEGRRLEQAARQVQFDHNASVKPQTDALRAQADALQSGPQYFAVDLRMNAREFESPAADRVVFNFGTPNPRRSAGLRVHSMQVVIRGPAGPARDAVAGLIDQTYLKSLIGKPLPEVAASQQRIQANIAGAAAAPPLAIASTVPLPAGGAASPEPTAAAPSAAAAAAPASVTAAAPTGAQRQPCPPADGQTAEAARTGSQVGAEVGGAAVGGGWGRSLGSAIGGALGALGGAAKKPDTAPVAANDCPR